MGFLPLSAKMSIAASCGSCGSHWGPLKTRRLSFRSPEESRELAMCASFSAYFYFAVTPSPTPSRGPPP